jgi:hypothetical protein
MIDTIITHGLAMSVGIAIGMIYVNHLLGKLVKHIKEEL